MKSILVAVILSLFLVSPVSSQDASIVLNGTSPIAYGSSITFHAIYPQDAAKQSRQPQYPDNPNIQVDCLQTLFDGTTYTTYNVDEEHTIINTKTKQKLASGWWQGDTFAVTILGNSMYDKTMSATCGAILYSFDVNNQEHVWATSPQFSVSPQ